jgi:hypothetical protein
MIRGILWTVEQKDAHWFVAPEQPDNQLKHTLVSRSYGL